MISFIISLQTMVNNSPSFSELRSKIAVLCAGSGINSDDLVGRKVREVEF
jgi:hypothetical protein